MKLSEATFRLPKLTKRYDMKKEQVSPENRRYYGSINKRWFTFDSH